MDRASHMGKGRNSTYPHVWGRRRTFPQGSRARLAERARVRDQKFEDFRTSNPEIWIAPFAHVSRFTRHDMWLLAGFFSILLKVVRDAGKDVEGAVHAAESKAGGIEVRDRGVVVLPFHKEPPFLSRQHF